MRLNLSEKQVMDAITSVLMENRKVLKIGNQAPSTPPAPDMGMPAMQDPSTMGDPTGQMGAAGDPGAMDPSTGPNAMGGDEGMENQFDSDFDAGVEADEETDPQHYIQQLTGKLSQSLNSFNSEQGPDAGLCKYVANMIIAATCKNLDEKDKKELIEKINTAASDEEEMPDEGGEGDMGEQPEGGEEMEQQPMMERRMTKRELQELAMGVQDRQENLPNKSPKRNIFSGKMFN